MLLVSKQILTESMYIYLKNSSSIEKCFASVKIYISNKVVKYQKSGVKSYICNSSLDNTESRIFWICKESLVSIRLIAKLKTKPLIYKIYFQ